MTNKTTAEEIAKIIRTGRGNAQAFLDGYEGKDSDAEMIRQYHQSRLNAIAKEVEGLKLLEREFVGGWYKTNTHSVAHNKALEQVLKIIRKHTE